MKEASGEFKIRQPWFSATMTFDSDAGGLVNFAHRHFLFYKLRIGSLEGQNVSLPNELCR